MDSMEKERSPMKGKTSIEGALRMLDDSKPHVAVPVQVVSCGTVVATTLSDESGRYRFVDLKPGKYQIRCQVLDGHIYYTSSKDRIASNIPSRQSTTDGEMLEVTPDTSLSDIDFRFPPLKKGTWRYYTPIDGLASISVHTVCQSPDGALWFASSTQYNTAGNGVSRYDGKEFVTFTTKDGLVGNNVYDIYAAPDGVMWFTTIMVSVGGGVSRYDGKEFINFTTEDGLAYNSVRAIHHDTRGDMWFGTDGGGVSRYDGKEFVDFTTKDGLAGDNVNAINGAPDGVVWFGTDGGVSRYDGRELINLTTEDGLAGNCIYAINGASDGVVWFGTDSGVSRYDGREFANLTTEDGLAHNIVIGIHRDLDGVMWFGTWGGGVSRYDGKTFVNFTTADGLPFNWVDAIYRDLDGVLWFGASAGSVARYDENSFVTFTTKDGLPHNVVSVIHTTPDGTLWIGTQEGIAGYSAGCIGRCAPVVFTPKDELSNDVRAITSAPDGTLWFGLGGFQLGGVFRYDGGECGDNPVPSFVNFTTEDELAHDDVRAIYIDPDGVTWIATQGGGVSRYDGREFVNFTEEDGLASNLVYAIHRDSEGLLWFGTYVGVSRYDGKEFVNLTRENGLTAEWVGAIHEYPDGVMWFGTASGVFRYDGSGMGDFPHFVNFTTEDGLANDTVMAIHRDTDGVMWFGTMGGGVSGYDGVAWTSLDTRDGLADDTVICIKPDTDGALLFGTLAGLTRYRRSKISSAKVHIASITTDQTYRDLSGIPAFIPGSRVTIEYSAIDFKTIPEKRQYRCRIEEIDSDWRKPTKEDSFDYVFDKPGTYTFQVQAIDRDLNYSEPASVDLQVIPDPRNHRIAQLEGELAERERAEMERMQQELEDARRIQQSLLPENPPELEGFEIAGTSLPAREVSGDFYNYLPLGDSISIVLADVTGKSVKAAMVAALTDGMLSEAINAQGELWDSPGKILRRLSIGIRPRLIRGMYAAMSLGIIRAEEKRLIFSNAGMPYPIVKRGKEVWELEVNGMPLGLMDNAEYQDLSLDLEEGDFVVLYSDGVIEAENEAEEMYQTERLLEVLQKASPTLSAQEMVDLIVGDVTAYAGNEEASDDITIVALRCKE